MEVLTFAAGLTIEKAAQGAQISLLKKDGQFKAAIKAISLMLKDVCNYLELNFNEDVSIDIAVNISTKYYYFRLEDVLLCLTKGKRGDFGKVYHKTLSIVVTEWLEQYDALQECHYVQRAENGKTEFGSNERTNQVVTFADLAQENAEFYKGYRKGLEKGTKNKRDE